MFKAALLINNCQNLKATRKSVSRGWTNKLQYLQTAECNSALKRNQLASHENTWKNLTFILLSERSQSKKATQDRIPTT